MGLLDHPFSLKESGTKSVEERGLVSCLVHLVRKECADFGARNSFLSVFPTVCLHQLSDPSGIATVLTFRINS